MSFPKARFARHLGWMASLLTQVCIAGTSQKTAFSLPDEIEAVGGMGAAQSHAGVAFASDLSALSLNPAMLFKNQAYEVSGTYYWPSIGRPFYKAGIIDGLTSKTVAAFEYTGFAQDFDESSKLKKSDSSVLKRGSVGISIPTDFFALGLAAHYIEANLGEGEPLAESSLKKDFTLGLGLAAFLTDEIRIGISTQNLNNERVSRVAPTVSRAGFAWEDKQGNVSLGLEYRRRERDLFYELPEAVDGLALAEEQKEAYQQPEQMVVGNLQVKTFDVVRIFASYGKSLDQIEREQAGGGVGLFHRTFSLAYALHKNLPSEQRVQSSLSFSLFMKI